MRFLHGIIGNSSEVNVESVEKDLERFLLDGENVDRAFVVIRDLMVFTNKRLILIDKQGVTGKKKEYRSIPYKTILHFSIETNGHFEIDAELKIFIKEESLPVVKKFTRDGNIFDVQKTLLKYMV